MGLIMKRIYWKDSHRIVFEGDPCPWMEGGNIYPLAEESADYDPRIHTLVGPEWVMRGGQVFQTWTPQEKSVVEIQKEQVATVKTEASAEILVKYPLWKQNNMLAEMVELLKLRMSNPWTAEQQTRVDGLGAIWAEIKEVRAVSNDRETAVLEATTGVEVVGILDTPYPGGGAYRWDFETQTWRGVGSAPEEVGSAPEEVGSAPEEVP